MLGVIAHECICTELVQQSTCEGEAQEGGALLWLFGDLETAVSASFAHTHMHAH